MGYLKKGKNKREWYHMPTTNLIIKPRTTYNRDYHYHDNTQSNDPHLDMYQDNSQKNLVSCILFNRDDHKGHQANVFFNQFVNHPEFKNKSSSPTELKINTHANWSLEDLLPKRRSFFYTMIPIKKIPMWCLIPLIV